ncbi:hypothetical protein POPTR_001G393001v4 [Populus trichocarpa]|uniref:Uncharacterized protein n=1 Tax=Populus trichocarpa TaxID=3694 RepID=A0A3N7EGR4_POPTR|nr:uncharacterized protein LOC18095509 [Populus trichocarpa]RQO85929.1 hypothetical protein POPTR_001G393001v4 [Populus trichocarpa]|eukprot:XP_006370173.1 uncharacterized protein LOC18095509 [Populus trichocarpa]
MENISEASPSPSPGSSSLASLSIQMVSKSVSERLLGKFFDASQYDFDYEQSGLWSPPIPARRVFLASPAGHIYSQGEFFSELKKGKRACRRRIACFNAFWCTSRRQP